MKKKLLVSVSGGETSMYMAVWLWQNKRDEYDMIFVFANTGQENEETLVFVEMCSQLFGFHVVWIEAKVYYSKRKSTGHTITNFLGACRDGQPFEAVIKKYGIPNSENPNCTRELKQNPIKSYAKSIGWKKWHTAIGIREDEIDRIDSDREKKRFIYPLASFRPMTKPKINFWWSQQPFRLNLKGYQGNCKTCYKKSDNKLFALANENPNQFLFTEIMESKYGWFVNKARLKKAKKEKTRN